MTDTAKALLAAAIYAKGRFRGRAELTRKAQRGDLYALEELCQRLGVPLPEQQWALKEYWRREHAPAHPLYEAYMQAQRAAAQGEPGSAHLRARGAYEAAKARLQRARRESRPPAAPEPGRIAEMARQRQEAAESERLLSLIQQASYEAGLSTAKHAHSDKIYIVQPGQEDAVSDVTYLWPSEVGLPQAYGKKGFRVTQSLHYWYLSPGSTPYAYGDRVYLSPVVRVRSGRGTSLVVECLSAGRGGALVWRVR